MILNQILSTILKANVWKSVWRICMWILGLKGLSNDNGDGYENVTYKVNLRCLKLNRAYSISLNSSNVGKVFWS